MRIVVCDLGVGNVASVVRAVRSAVAERPGAIVELSGRPEDVRGADALVVPGQGHFGAFAAAMRGGLGEALVDRIRSGSPYFGICLGMQVLFETSDEAPGERGLAVFRGHVARLEPGTDPETGRSRPLPHIGWNAVEGAIVGHTPKHFYFAHTFAVVPEDPTLVAGTTEYGTRFASAVARDAIVGVQFHPEKSQEMGLGLLTRFFGRF
jgi:imidazole glycerol-phosphate synthase subunit HisH